jgi:hypothetical protein
MATIQLNQIQTKLDKDGSTFFEVWIEYPYDLLETLNKGKKSIIPMYSNDINELRTKVNKAYATKRLIQSRRGELDEAMDRRYIRQLKWSVFNNFSFLLSDSFSIFTAHQYQ